MALDLPDLSIMVGGAPQRQATTIETVSAYVVVLETVLVDHALTLTSVYLGQIDGTTATAHLLLRRAAPATLEQRLLPAVLPGEKPAEQRHTRTCLLDHLAELQRALAADGEHPVYIDIGPIALERAARAWRDDQLT